jgi:hypothetical protein
MVWLARFESRRCVLSFEDPLAMETVRIDGRIYPLAADSTVPLAVALARTNPKKFELTRMLNPAKYAETARIARLQPYDLNKTGALLAVHMDADWRLVHGIFFAVFTKVFGLNGASTQLLNR